MLAFKFQNDINCHQNLKILIGVVQLASAKCDAIVDDHDAI